MFGWLFGSDDKTDSDKCRHNQKKDQGIFGIDWDGDGEVSEFDDFVTVDILSDEDD